MLKIKQTAFTLIELLVVIAIIGILSGLIIVGMNGMTQKANIAKSQVFSTSLRNSLMLNIISEWTFDNGPTAAENSATSNDVKDSWKNVNLNIGGGPVIKSNNDCIFKKCIYFDGSDDYLYTTSGSTDLNNTSFVISFWINLERFGDPLSPCDNDRANMIHWVSGYDDGIALVNNSDGSIGFVMKTGGVAAGIGEFESLNLNKWYYFLINYNKQTGVVDLYRDGKIIYTGTAQPLSGISQPFIIGGGLNNWCGTAHSRGKMDDVRIFNASLPTSKIQEQYYIGLNKLFASGELTQKEYQNRVGTLAIAKR